MWKNKSIWHHMYFKSWIHQGDPVIFAVCLQKLEKSNLDNWENIRGPSPWEDSRTVQKERREALRLKTEWLSKPPLVPLKKKVSGWTVLIFNPVSGTDMGAFAMKNSAGVYISNSEISTKGIVLYEALCLHPFVYSTTDCICEFSIKKSWLFYWEYCIVFQSLTFKTPSARNNISRVTCQYQKLSS